MRIQLSQGELKTMVNYLDDQELSTMAMEDSWNNRRMDFRISTTFNTVEYISYQNDRIYNSTELTIKGSRFLELLAQDAQSITV